MKRYEALAADIEASIRNGTLKTGDRLPSVRHTGQSRGVSASTVFQAYYLLEARGLVRARDRSGYYVTGGGLRDAPPESTLTSRPADGPLSLDVSDQVFDILEASMSRKVVPFGSAFPSPLLFPLARLGQFMAASAKSLDPWSTVDDLTPGSAALRRQIALRYLAEGMPVPADELVVTNGALEALNLCLAAVTRPGDAVIVESPTFYAALQALQRMGLRAIEVPTHPGEGIDLGALELAIAAHKPSACWLMTTFQNPLGSLMPDAKKKALVALLARHALPLIEDDVYAELYFGERRPAPAKAFDTQGWCCTARRSPSAWRRATASAGPRPGALHGRSRGRSSRPRSALRRPRSSRSRAISRKAGSTSTCASCARRWRCSRPPSRRPWATTFRRARARRGRWAATSCGSSCRHG